MAPRLRGARLSIELSNRQTVVVDEARIVEVARRTAESVEAAGEISISLVDEDAIASLNLEYLNAKGPTDVLSFPVDGLAPPMPSGRHAEAPPVLIGEVVICPQVAERQAAGRRPGRLQDQLADELDLLSAHGVLHLLGYDHDTEENAQTMRTAEHKAIGQSGAQAT